MDHGRYIIDRHSPNNRHGAAQEDFMPITLTFTEGVIAAEKAPIAVARITEAFLRHHGLAGNRIMAANVTAHLNILAKGHTFAGGEPVDGAWIETKTPSFALASHDIQTAFFG